MRMARKPAHLYGRIAQKHLDTWLKNGDSSKNLSTGERHQLRIIDTKITVAVENKFITLNAAI